MADGGGPTEQDRSEGMPSISEAPNDRGKALGYLGLFQVTRRKGGSLRGRYRRNGYVHLKEIGWLSGRNRWQASSHRGTWTSGGTLVDCQGAMPSLASQLPQGSLVIKGLCKQGPTGRMASSTIHKTFIK
jgi:hypothetical protein